MASEKQQAELPLRSAGGGNPSEAASNTPVREFQHGGPTETHLKAIYQKHAKDLSSQEGVNASDETSFIEYMRSRASSAVAPPPHLDLSQPLSSYYISSSHNTYLTGHQLYGDATTAGYTNVLRRGCRCLEIDVWDGDDSDTSASSSDEEEGPSGTSPAPRQSRWRKMKAKASQIRRPSASKDRTSHQDASPKLDISASFHPTSQSLTPVSSNVQQPFRPEPQVVHGWTLTQAVPFRAVCAAIRDSAFIATDLPLIVSLETHASLEQQQIMVEIMKEAWGDYLVDIDASSKKECNSLPSPDSLRGKILIKVKWASSLDSSDSGIASEAGETSTAEKPAEGAPAKKKNQSKMLQSLSDLGMFTRAFSFKRWDQPEATIPTHVFSLTESKAHGMHSDPMHGPAMFNHNKTFLTRIYPKGTRITSSNYDPAFHWRYGAQMVALNWQSLDEGMMLNEGMFAGYGGWVLKPDGFRSQNVESKDVTADNKAGIAATAAKRQFVQLKIQVFSGENLPVPLERDPSHAAKLKPYLKFELHVDTHGAPGQGKSGGRAKTDGDVEDEDKKEREKHKRRSETQKTESPNFRGELFTWNEVEVVEQLSFLRYVMLSLPFLFDLFDSARYCNLPMSTLMR